VRQKAVVNPVAGETDDQVDVLHCNRSLTRQPAIGPIGQDGGSVPKSISTGFALGTKQGHSTRRSPVAPRNAAAWHISSMQFV
jgi:hypothetical protein